MFFLQILIYLSDIIIPSRRIWGVGLVRRLGCPSGRPAFCPSVRILFPEQISETPVEIFKI